MTKSPSLCSGRRVTEGFLVSKEVSVLREVVSSRNPVPLLIYLITHVSGIYYSVSV